MAKRESQKASRRAGGREVERKARRGADTGRAQRSRKTQQKGGSLRMGEGVNFGKGQQRRTQGTRSGASRVRGETVTRRPQVLGMRGGQRGETRLGGEAPTRGRGAGRPRDSGGEPSEAPLRSSTRPDERKQRFDYSDELEQGF